ncbi:aldo/keto reductase [Catellatospora citrea]|uniref:aldo/keto reductase n=1 Tax=Catellatospora citrea TaxID=53366 RepID=UPI0033CFA8B7
MRYTTFGRNNGLRVSEYGLGTGNFGTRWGAGAEPAEARKMFDRFAEAGGTLLDTADNYQAGQAEELLGEFMGAERDRFVVAGKYGNNGVGPRDVTNTGNSRKHLHQAVEASLKRLGTDYLDILWAHAPDDLTPVEEILRGFDDLVSAGKIRYGALSNFPAWRVSRAATLTELRGWSPVVGIQVEYSLVDRTAERELLPMAQSLGLGAALWGPLGGGLLTGKYRKGDGGRLSDLKILVHTEDSAQKTAVVDAVLDVAAELGVPASQVAVAWLREKGARAATAYVPIIGPRSLAQLDDYLGALEVTLNPAQFARLEEVSAVRLGTPHELNAWNLAGIRGGDASAVDGPAIPVA